MSGSQPRALCVGGWQHPASPQPPHCHGPSALSTGTCGCHPTYTTPSLDSEPFIFEAGSDFSLNALWRWKCSFHRSPAHAPPVRSHTCGNQSSKTSLTSRASLTAFSPGGERGRRRGPGELQLSVPSPASLWGVHGLAPPMGTADRVVSLATYCFRICNMDGGGILLPSRVS